MSTPGYPLVAAATFGLLVACTVCNAATDGGPPPDEGRRDAALDVDVAIAEALRHNPELRLLEARVNTARRQAVVAGKYPFNPELGVEEGLERRFGVGQVLEWPGKRTLRAAIANQDVAAADAALVGFRVSLAAETAARFSELLAARKIVELRGREVEAAARVFKIARRRVAQAFAPVTERSTAAVGAVRARRDLREAEKATDQARAGLNALLGREAAAPLNAEGELSAPRPAVPLERLAALAVERHPDLQVARHEVDKRRLAVSLARRERISDVTVEPFYAIDTGSAGDQKAGVGVKVPLPLWNTGTANVAAADAERREAEAALEKTRRDVLAELAKAHAAFVAASEELALYAPELLAELDTELAATERGYESGQLPFLVLLQARRSYFEHRKDYYDALAGAHVAQAALEKAAAVRLEDIK